MVIWLELRYEALAAETKVPTPKQPLYPSMAAEEGVEEAAELEADFEAEPDEPEAEPDEADLEALAEAETEDEGVVAPFAEV